MTDVRVLIHDSDQDWAIRIDDRHTVDVGPGAVDPTHYARDGRPMEVRYSPEHGYLVAVQMDEED